jgi:hypothetical protein
MERMSERRVKLIRLLVCVVAAAAASGCGGGDDNGASAGRGESGANGGEGSPALPVVLRVEKPRSSRVKTTASAVTVEGHVTPGSRLTVNGRRVSLYAAFFHTTVKELPYGESRIALQASKRGLRPVSRTLAVTRVRPSATGTQAGGGAAGVAGGGGPRITPRRGVRLSPRPSETEADLRKYLKRNFGKEDWYGSITGVSVTASGVTARTSLRAGDPRDRAAANAICRALHFARLPLPNFVKAKNGATLTAC